MIKNTNEIVVEFIFGGTLIFILVLIFIWDFRYRRIPLFLNLGILGLAIFYQSLYYFFHEAEFFEEIVKESFLMSFNSSTVVAIKVGIICVLPFLLCNILNVNSFGGGDLKMIFSIAFLIDIEMTMEILILGLIFSGMCGLLFILRDKEIMDRGIPLGSFLSLSILIKLFNLW